MAGESMLLIKNIQSNRLDEGQYELYSFQTHYMRGFQEGSLKSGAHIEAFDSADRELTFLIRAKSGDSCFAQSDLNLILSTLRPVPKS
jgi:hypothetical protein